MQESGTIYSAAVQTRSRYQPCHISVFLAKTFDAKRLHMISFILSTISSFFNLIFFWDDKCQAVSNFVWSDSDRGTQAICSRSERISFHVISSYDWHFGKNGLTIRELWYQKSRVTNTGAKHAGLYDPAKNVSYLIIYDIHLSRFLCLLLLSIKAIHLALFRWLPFEPWSYMPVCTYRILPCAVSGFDQSCPSMLESVNSLFVYHGSHRPSHTDFLYSSDFRNYFTFINYFLYCKPLPIYDLNFWGSWLFALNALLRIFDSHERNRFIGCFASFIICLYVFFILPRFFSKVYGLLMSNKNQHFYFGEIQLSYVDITVKQKSQCFIAFCIFKPRVKLPNVHFSEGNDKNRSRLQLDVVTGIYSSEEPIIQIFQCLF